jgi:HAD superfamily hydrolase (TIGR01509 family)
MPIRGLLFDANGVLYSRPRRYARLESFLAPYGLQVLPAEQMRLVVAREHVAAQTGQMPIADYFAAQLRACGLHDAGAIATAAGIMLEDCADIELFPNAVEALEALRSAGVALAIVTDSAHPIERKLGWLEARGLSRDVFDVAISSVELGVCKPDPRIYMAALDRLGFAADAAAFVGHASDEIAGAAEVGLTTIAFRPDDPSVCADACIDDLLSLVRDLSTVMGVLP